VRAAKKVWVLWYREYDDTEIMGVYSTKRRAQQMIRYVTRFARGRRTKTYFEIEEHGLDAMAVKVDLKIVKVPKWVRR